MFQFKNTFKSLKKSNFRLFFFAQMVSLIGTWVQGTAQSWLLWQMTNSQWLLGLLGFTQMSPVLLFGLIGGIFADKFKRKKLLLITQSLALVQALLFACLLIFNLITPLLIFLLALVLGTINAFDMTGRQTFIGDLVGLKDVGNAIALNSLLFNIARVIGPPIAGFVIAHYGFSICFIINAISFLFVLLALIMIKVDPQQQLQIEKEKSLSPLRDTLRYFKKNKIQLRVLILLSLVSFSMLPFAYFLPYFADRVFLGKAQILGFLLSSIGCGAMIGAIVMANHPNIEKLPTLVGVSSLILALSLFVFTFSNSLYLSSILLVLAGFATMVTASSCNIFFQSTAPPLIRGKVISFYVISLTGLPPVGGLLAGIFAEFYDIPLVLFLCSLIGTASSLSYLLILIKEKLTLKKYN